MLSQTVEYALRAVVCLAEHEGPQTNQQIAEVTKVPAAYLSKIMQNLSKSDLVRSQRGLHGGFHLAKLPAELTLLDVVEAIDPIRRIRSCPLNIDEHVDERCPLHKRLDDALAAMEEAFRSTTVEQILADPSLLRPLRANQFDVEIDLDTECSKADKCSTGEACSKNGNGHANGHTNGNGHA